MLEYIMIALVWIFVFCAILTAAGIPAAVWFMAQKKEKRRGIVCFGVCLVLVVGILSWLCQNPLVCYAAECTDKMTSQQESNVLSVSDGLYSGIVPLVPVLVRVTEVEEKHVEWTIHYFPFGDLGMEYSEGDGFSITKNLTGW